MYDWNMKPDNGGIGVCASSLFRFKCQERSSGISL